MTNLEGLLRQANAKGTDAEYHQWVKRQPSAISGVFSEYHMDAGEAFSIPCHVRRSSGAGTAFKEPYTQVPMRDCEHKAQSVYGETECLRRYLGGTWSVEAAKAWFNEKRIEYLERL